MSLNTVFDKSPEKNAVQKYGLNSKNGAENSKSNVTSGRIPNSQIADFFPFQNTKSDFASKDYVCLVDGCVVPSQTVRKSFDEALKTNRPYKAPKWPNVYLTEKVFEHEPYDTLCKTETFDEYKRRDRERRKVQKRPCLLPHRKNKMCDCIPRCYSIKKTNESRISISQTIDIDRENDNGGADGVNTIAESNRTLSQSPNVGFYQEVTTQTNSSKQIDGESRIYDQNQVYDPNFPTESNGDSCEIVLTKIAGQELISGTFQETKIPDQPKKNSLVLKKKELDGFINDITKRHLKANGNNQIKKTIVKSSEKHQLRLKKQSEADIVVVKTITSSPPPTIVIDAVSTIAVTSTTKNTDGPITKDNFMDKTAEERNSILQSISNVKIPRKSKGLTKDTNSSNVKTTATQNTQPILKSSNVPLVVESAKSIFVDNDEKQTENVTNSGSKDSHETTADDMQKDDVQQEEKIFVSKQKSYITIRPEDYLNFDNNSRRRTPLAKKIKVRGIKTAQKYLEKLFAIERITKYLQYLQNFNYQNIDRLQILDNDFCSILTQECLQEIFDRLKEILLEAVDNGKEKTDTKIVEIEITLNYLFQLISQKQKE